MKTRLTPSMMGLSDQDFRAVPAAEKAIVDAIHAYTDQNHVSGGTLMGALACIVGEHILMTGDEAEQAKQWFIGLIEAYLSADQPADDEPSLIRKPI